MAMLNLVMIRRNYYDAVAREDVVVGKFSFVKMKTYIKNLTFLLRAIL